MLVRIPKAVNVRPISNTKRELIKMVSEVCRKHFERFLDPPHSNQLLLQVFADHQRTIAVLGNFQISCELHRIFKRILHL